MFNLLEESALNTETKQQRAHVQSLRSVSPVMRGVTLNKEIARKRREYYARRNAKLREVARQETRIEPDHSMRGKIVTSDRHHESGGRPWWMIF